MAFLQRNFVQGKILPIVTYKILAHGDSMHMSWNQDFRIRTSCLRVWNVLRDLNIWDPSLYITSHCAWSGTYRLETSALSFIWYLMTILILSLQDRIRNLQYGQNLSPFNMLRVYMTMRTMLLAFLMSCWSQWIWKSEGISNTRGTPRS